MRTRSIQPGDIVYANKKGRLFHAKVLGAGDGGVLIVEPIEQPSWAVGAWPIDEVRKGYAEGRRGGKSPAGTVGAPRAGCIAGEHAWWDLSWLA